MEPITELSLPDLRSKHHRDIPAGKNTDGFLPSAKVERNTLHELEALAGDGPITVPVSTNGVGGGKGCESPSCSSEGSSSVGESPTIVKKLAKEPLPDGVVVATNK